MGPERQGHIEVIDGKLHIGGVEAERLADEFGTPLYVYNGDRILEAFNEIRDSFGIHADREVRILYAMKANSSLAVLKLLEGAGAWIDTVSPFEAKLALDAGFAPGRVLYTGTSVSDNDLEYATNLGVMLNIDSFSQMRRLAKLGKFRISIRWNPGEGVGHHEHVITAGEFVKFGIPEDRILDAVADAGRLGLELVGLHQHIGSGMLGSDVDIFLGTVDKTLQVAKSIQQKLGRDLEFVDFGGGLGIPYKPGDPGFPMDKYCSGICEKVRKSGLGFKAICVEPGRYIVGDSGIMLTRVNTVEQKGVPLIGVDSGFNMLLRPALYGAYHEMLICGKADREPDGEWMVAGNLCESVDVFNENMNLRPLPKPDEGDVVAILNAGAYGFSMSSRYNSWPLPAEVLITEGQYRLTRERETYDDLAKGQGNPVF